MIRRQPHREVRSCLGFHSHTWTFPLSGNKGVTAEIRIDGPAVGLAEIQSLKRYVDLLELTFTDGGDQQLGPSPEAIEAIIPADIVQIRPSADATFGGLLFRVTQITSLGVRGYPLVPHRGGCRQAWHRYKVCALGRIGALRWPEAEWGFRDGDELRRRRMWCEL